MENENERRTILAIGLSLFVYMVWVAYFSPPPVPRVEGVATVADLEEAPAVDASAPSEQRTGEKAPSRTVPPEPVSVPDRRIDVGTTIWSGTFGSREGAISSIDLTGVTAQPKVTPIWTHLLSKAQGEGEGWTPYIGGGDPQELLSDRGGFVVAGNGDFTLELGYVLQQTDTGFSAVGQARNGVRITKTYERTDNPNTLDIAVRFDNLTDQPIRDLWVGVVDAMSGDSGRFTNAPRPFALVQDDVERLDDLEEVDDKGPVVNKGTTEWFGVGDKYFMSVLVPTEVTGGDVAFAGLGDGRYGAFRVEAQSLDAGASRTLQFTAFVGPKNLDILVPIGHHLDRSVEFGWFGFFAKALLWLLKSFHGIAGNWGVAIIMLTLLVKIVFFPLMQKQFVSSKRMQELQPELKAMKEKYKDNRELQTQMTMKLFKEHQVNPMGGCLPMLIQMPVWFALYNVMLFSVELYNTPFLYLQDLTEVDPYGALPVLVTVLMLVQQRLMPMGSMDPMQQKMMRLMPLMFGIFMFSFPSGLVLYFTINNTLTILQQWIIYRKKKEPPVKATN